MPQTAGFALAHVVHRRQIRRLLYERQPVGVPLGAKRLFEFVVAVEVVLERPLAAARDHQDVVEPGSDGLLDDVLDRRLINDRQHLFRRRLRGRQEAGAETGGRDDGLGDLPLRHDRTPTFWVGPRANRAQPSLRRGRSAPSGTAISVSGTTRTRRCWFDASSSVASAKRQPSRPASFAAYKASSALRSNRDGVMPCSGNTATPIEAVTSRPVCGSTA